MRHPELVRSRAPRTRALVAAGAILVALAAPARAQVISTIDAGASSVSYGNGYRAGAISLSPAMQLERGRSSLFASGTFSRFDTGELASSGTVVGSLLSGPIARVRGEIAITAAGSAHEDATRAGLFQAQLRAHATSGDAGVWLGAGAARGTAGLEWRTLASAEAGAWWRRGALLFTSTVAPTRMGDTSWTDVVAGGRWMNGALEAGGSLGLRAGDSGSDAGAWAGASGLWWLTRHLALNAAAGSYRAEHAQGTPGGRYVTLGIRIATRPPLIDRARASGSIVAPDLMRPVAGAISVSGTGARRTLRIAASGARTVEVMGDFTQWRVVQLERARGGAWELSLPITPGSHRFNVRVNGGDWGVPRGVTTITDDFEGVVGLLVVR